jgi:hypothetical protein
MAKQSVPFDFDKMAAEEALAKARAIVEIVGKSITAHLGFDNGAPYSDSLWAAADQLDKLGQLTGLDPKRQEVANG